MFKSVYCLLKSCFLWSLLWHCGTSLVLQYSKTTVNSEITVVEDLVCSLGGMGVGLTIIIIVNYYNCVTLAYKYRSVCDGQKWILCKSVCNASRIAHHWVWTCVTNLLQTLKDRAHATAWGCIYGIVLRVRSIKCLVAWSLVQLCSAYEACNNSYNLS